MFDLRKYFAVVSGSRFEAFDGLRAGAILLVFGVHAFGNYAAQDYGVSSPYLLAVCRFFNAGHIGVDLFFILSGFLIFYILNGKPITFFKFMSKRFKRLLPAHVFVLFLLLLVFIRYFWPFNFQNLLMVIANVFFIDQFLPGIKAINFVSWSLSYELAFYISMGLWVTAGRKWKFLNSWPAWVILIAAIHSSQWVWPHYLGNPLKYLDTARWVGFFWGVLLAKFYFSEKKTWSKIQVWPVKLALPAVFVVLILQAIWSIPGQAVWFFENRIALNFYYGILHLAFAVLVAAMLSERLHPLKKLFSIQSIRWLGLISYSFYLIHATLAIPISAYFLKWIPGVFYKMSAHYGVAFVLTLILSGLNYHFFERPYFSQKNVK